MLHITFELNYEHNVCFPLFYHLKFYAELSRKLSDDMRLSREQLSEGPHSGSRRKSTGSIEAEKPSFIQQISSPSLFAKRPPEAYKQERLADNNTSLLSQLMRQAEESNPPATSSIDAEHTEDGGLHDSEESIHADVTQDMLRSRSFSMNDLLINEASPPGIAPRDQLRQLLRSLYWQDNFHAAGW